MSAGRQHKQKPKKAPQPTPGVETTKRPPCQEHPDNEKADDVTKTDNNSSDVFSRGWKFYLPIFISVLALFAYFGQAYIMRQAMRVDQRAWVIPTLPNDVPSNDPIEVLLQMQNTGKTPATDIWIDYIATPMSKGDRPSFDFRVGHPHDRLYGGSLYPQSPGSAVRLYLSHYGAENSGKIPYSYVRGDIESGKQFLIFYGIISYRDVFGIKHWSKFCMGTGTAYFADMKTCVTANTVDTNN